MYLAGIAIPSKTKNEIPSKIEIKRKRPIPVVKKLLIEIGIA